MGGNMIENEEKIKKRKNIRTQQCMKNSERNIKHDLFTIGNVE